MAFSQSAADVYVDAASYVGTMPRKRFYEQVDVPTNPVWHHHFQQQHHQNHNQHQQSNQPQHPCKRPRRMLTPGSVISAITHETDSANVSPHSVFEPSPQYQLPTTHCSTFNNNNNSSHQTYHVTATPSYQPTYHPITPPSELRSDEDIKADVTNSFANGQGGTMSWSAELLIQVLATEVEEIIHSNDDRDQVDVGHFQTFYSSYKQPFELDFYMRRLVQYVNCSHSVFVTMFVYLDRVQERCKPLLASDMNCHRLVFTCLVLAVKYLEDEVHSNAYYARVGGLTVEEMNMLEVKLLQVLGWNLSVSPETYAIFEESMIQTAGLLLGGIQGGYGSSVSDE